MCKGNKLEVSSCQGHQVSKIEACWVCQMACIHWSLGNLRCANHLLLFNQLELRSVRTVFKPPFDILMNTLSSSSPRKPGLFSFILSLILRNLRTSINKMYVETRDSRLERLIIYIYIYIHTYIYRWQIEYICIHVKINFTINYKY